MTKDSVHLPDEVWEFFHGLSFSRLGFNAEETEGINIVSSLRSEEDIRQYKQFFKRILELNDMADRPIIIREFELFKDKLQRMSPLIRAHTNIPLALLNFDCDGNVSTFSPELLSIKHPSYGNFIYSNVFEGKLEDIQYNEKFLAVRQQIQEGVLQCLKSCPYFAFCGGGSPSNKLCENQTFDSTETIACRLDIKTVVDAAMEHLEEAHQIPPSS